MSLVATYYYYSNAIPLQSKTRSTAMQSSTVGPINETISDEHTAVHHHTPPSTAIGAGASASANVASNKDNNTQSDINDVPNGSTDGIDADIEIMNREMERYAPRSPPYNPAAGNQVRNPPVNNANRPPGAPKGRPPAVTANPGTTAQPKRGS